jgi:hypothetical protein
VVVPHHPRQNEDVAIVSFNPMLPGQILFVNVRNVLEDFLINSTRVGFRNIQPCPFGAAYVQFAHLRDRDRLVRESPLPFGDVFVSFVKHNEGIDWRRA